MVVIGIKRDMFTAKNNQRIRTRNYADWKLLKDGCRHSATCDDSDDEDAFDPGEIVADEHLRGGEQLNDSGDTEQRWAIPDTRPTPGKNQVQEGQQIQGFHLRLRSERLREN